MATAMIDGKRTVLSMAEKARLLDTTSEKDGYRITSGSDSRKSYHVSENCMECTCGAYGPCSHRLAASWFKAAEQPRRVATCDYCSGYHNSLNCFL